MPSIENLINDLPEISQSRLVASGYGVWIVWKDKLNNAVKNTLREYGALCVAEELDQALWFCNTTEVFRALARLYIWARVNPMPVSCQVIPLTFLVDYDMNYSVSLSPELDHQEASSPGDLEILIHPKLKNTVNDILGLSLQIRGGIPGLAPVEWFTMVADQGLDYETFCKWYYIIKPLGSLSEKEANKGWRELVLEIVELLRRLGLRYISDMEKGALILPLESFQLLRSFCSEMLKLIKRLKEDPEGGYWPVVMAAVPQQEYEFTSDLPQKIGLDWNRLSPDYPHVRLVDGFLLSEWFYMSETRYGVDAVSLDSWCTLALREDGGRLDHGTMQVALAHTLVNGENSHCFYCGQTGHKPRDCPSKQLEKPHPKVWQELAKTDVKDFTKGFSGVDAAVAEEDGSGSMLKLLSSHKGLESLMLRAVYEINAPAQLRFLRIVWRTRAKDWVEGMRQLAPQEGDFVWDALQRIESGDLENAEVQIKEAQLKYPRSYQPHSLWGFWTMESGDTNQALFHWQEAERMSYTPLQQGYFSYLQARLLEVDGNLKDAINTYKHANTYSPTWVDPVYRQGVCMVKMGFTGQAMDVFSDLIERDPHIFNRILVDPELDRGRVQLMSALWERWAEADEMVSAAKGRVSELRDDIARRFDENHSYYELGLEELDRLEKLAVTNNYVAYRQLLRGTDKFKQNLDGEVRREIKRIDSNLDYQAERIRDIQHEAAWFPFPKLLLEFNKDFNFCVDKINWIKTQQLKEPDKFRKALKFIDEIEEHIESLQGRLVTLRIVRDSTLFVLMLGRNFIWFELLGLGLALAAIPATLYFTQGMEGIWLLDAIREQRWEFSKGLVIIISVLCLVLAVLKSGITFDKRKRELFDQIEKEMSKSAPKRY
ncbi:tetratricopeptide repeat protein [Pseudodesulfovibrio cashew]|uniref:Tetratricopeptide repeat protein n=1 Tax=Pseudodesulfovibrio cashew TaxID=2678688 RepID=A0A6I6JIN1_9BACT|nr:tetratricopeptide repeat protein [Pseudodesulfovibrio cashew]QGY40940.1 tetratricopeptide repeat protein [Pseudodesulfovibrio cashew]